MLVRSGVKIILFLGVSLFVSFAIYPNSIAFAEDSSGFRLGPSLYETDTSSSAVSEGFHFNMDDWNEMRRSMEEGRPIGEIRERVVETTTTKVVEPPKPPPGQIKVDLPYESSLSVTGRKVISVDIKNIHTSAERAEETGGKQDTQSFEMEQQLQARIQGTVARKTTINVNYDDTKENVRDFSVIYQGDPDEVVQEAAFGDIVLSLPSTEFVNYNKQLFGIRTALKYKKFGLMAIGSRTKGTTETKRFVGSTTRNQVYVNDSDYIRYRYYDLTFSTTPAMGAIGIDQESVVGLNEEGMNLLVPEIVYIQDTTTNPLADNYQVASDTDPTGVPLTVRMRQLSRGVDYTVDPKKGVLVFANAIPKETYVAVDFTLRGTTTRLKDYVSSLSGFPLDGVLIKADDSRAPLMSQEIKRYYSAKARNIGRDNIATGNFIFKVMDKNRTTEIFTTPPHMQRYPDTIEMNFEQGIFQLDNPLDVLGIYDQNVNNSNPLQAVFSIEYQAIIRTFSLRPNIVLQSEKVAVDGRRVNRDLDYFIDYDIGVITFFNPDLIRESTVIEVTYEYAPFGGALGETLVGARGTYDILTNTKNSKIGLEKWSAGSTVLYNFASKPVSPPDIRSTPSSLLVTEGDSQIKGLQLGKFPMKINLSAEYAQSAQNPNLYGKAIVDSFEGLKQEDSATLLDDSWVVAANPVQGTEYNPNSYFLGREATASHLRWAEIDMQTTDQNDGDVSQKALQIGYTLNPTGSGATRKEQVSLIHVISLVGRDFSKKTTLEVELTGVGATNDNGADVDLIIDYGTFNEDADGDSVFDTEDREFPPDRNLQLGEDTGWAYNNPGLDLLPGTLDTNETTTYVNGDNSRLDSEDLNNDGSLNPTDDSATNTPLFVLSSTMTGTNNVDSVTVSDLKFNGTRLFKIPLDLDSLSIDEKNRLTAVKQVRVTIRNKSGDRQPKTGVITISRISMVGTSWDPPTITPTGISTMSIRGINNKDDPDYGPYHLVGNPIYNDLYKDSIPTGDDFQEQALAINYDLFPSLPTFSTGTTVSRYGAVRDLSKHDLLKFFIRKNPSQVIISTGGYFYFRAGSDIQYQEFRLPIEMIPRNEWLVVTLNQSDMNHDGMPDTWIPIPGSTVTVVGTPNLTQVSQLQMGVVNDTGSEIRDEIWVNEIFVDSPHDRRGNAKKLAFDSTLTGWMDFGATYREVDRNWQTPTTAITNQDHEQQTGYVNFTRLSVMPLGYRTSRDITITPSAFQSNANGLVSFLEEGRVEKVSHSGTASLLIPKLPQFTFSYDRNDETNTNTQRNQLDEIARSGMTYTNPLVLDLLPGRMKLKPLPSTITLNYTHRTTEVDYSELDRLRQANISTSPFSSTDIEQVSDEGEARLAFTFWDGFTFNPNYKLRVEKDKYLFREDERSALPSLTDIDQKSLPHSVNQTISASGNFRIFKWLDPRYNYSFSGTETNGRPLLTNTTAYLQKSIDRTSSGELTGALQMSQIVPKSKVLNTMNYNLSYKVENGDTYANVPDDFRWRNKFWVGTPLVVSSSPDNPATRTYSTDRRTFRGNVSWLPFSGYPFQGNRLRPFNSITITDNYLLTTERTNTLGTDKRVITTTNPDFIVTINEIEKVFNVQKVLADSRLILKGNTRRSETLNITKNETNSYGTDYQFKFYKKWDISTSFAITRSRDDDLILNRLSQKSDTKTYSLQTRIPKGSWAYTPRYQHSETDARDSVRVTNDLKDDTLALQIYGDINRPLGIRFGRYELGVANRMILNSTLQWNRKRSVVNPSTNYLDLYTATVAGDYTLSKNFRLTLGANYSQEIHQSEFSNLNQIIYGVNTTLTIQF